MNAISRTARIAAITLVGAFLAAGPLASQPASAAPWPVNGSCDAGELCLWSDINREGSLYEVGPGRYTNYHFDGDLLDYAGQFFSRTQLGLNDRASTIWNRTSMHVCVYRDANYRGPFIRMLPGNYAPANLTLIKTNLVTGNWNDKISSHRFIFPGESC